jgi:hypothetical protein
MNIYKISQDSNDNYDTFDSAVVCAENEETARKMIPCHLYDDDKVEPSSMDWSIPSNCWCASPDLVKVKLIGNALPGLPQGIICASFNAD